MASIDSAGTAGNLLQAPSKDHAQPTARGVDGYESLDTFDLPRGDTRHYQQQFADMYFARLAQLRLAVSRIAEEEFSQFEIAGERAKRVERVLDVRQGSLCWVVGTVYMDLPMKPDVLEDIGREHWIAAPPPRTTYRGQGSTEMMLEDESGRLKMVGQVLSYTTLVTGAIVAVIGTENKDGEFEVLDIKMPDLAPQQTRAAPTTNGHKSGKIAIVSGLDICANAADNLALELLGEYLTGELGGGKARDQSVNITRLLIAGNALTDASPIAAREEKAPLGKKRTRKYGYDSSTYNATPSQMLDSWLASMLPSIPITILPGDTDPTNVSLPQPPLHMALFPLSRAYAGPPGSDETGWFDSTTNPAQLVVAGHDMLVTGGQPVNDVFKYLDADSRLEMMEAMLRWRHIAPTAPDTLWSYPFQDEDRFVIKRCPHAFIAGNQPRYETGEISGPDGQSVRMIAVPSFKDTGIVVLLDTDTLECETIEIELFGDGVQPDSD